MEMMINILAIVGLTFLNYRALNWANGKFKLVTQSDPTVFFVLVGIGLSFLELFIFSFFKAFVIIAIVAAAIWYLYTKFIKTK